MTQQKITKKQQKIISLIPRFRFLNSSHIQVLLHHKFRPHINRWLNGLTKNQYIKKIYDEGIIGKNKKPAAFFMDNNGIRFIKERGLYPSLIHRLYWDKKRSETFINHCLMIATICCELEQKTTLAVSYSYTTKSDFADTDHKFHFLETITTDLTYSKKETGRKTKYYLLELFDERFPKYRLRNRIRKYIDYYYSNEWENNTSLRFPILLFVFETNERMYYTKRYTTSLFEDGKPKGLSMLFATADDVRAYGVTGQIWEPI